MNIHKLTTICCALLVAPAAVAAEISYSGRLTEQTGKPRSGTIDLEFKFFDEATAGTQLGATIVADDVPLAQGVFTVVLNIPDVQTGVVFGAAETWIEVRDRAQPQSLPRQRFLPVPHALRVPVDGSTITFNAGGKLQMGPDAPGVPSFLKIDGSGHLLWEAGSSGSVGPDQVETSSIQDAAVTGAKIADGAIDSNKIADGTIASADIANLDAAKLTGTVSYVRLPVGTVANTIAAGDDARFTNARTPSGAAGGKLSGTYPNPGVNLADTDIPTLTAAKISDFVTAAQAAEADPQVGANTLNYVSKWNGSALVAGQIFDNGTSVGIGTTSPTQLLDVAGTAKATRFNVVSPGNASAPAIRADSDQDTGIFFPTSDRMAFATGGSEAMRIDPAGKVGIGTTAPTMPLTVVGDASIHSPADPYVLLHNTQYNAQTTNLGGVAWTVNQEWPPVAQIAVTAGENHAVGALGTKMLFQTTPNGSVTAVDRMAIDEAGNVGIGTATPTAKLHIGGTPGTDGIRFPDGTLQKTAALSVAAFCGNTASSYTGSAVGGWTGAKSKCATQCGTSTAHMCDVGQLTRALQFGATTPSADAWVANLGGMNGGYDLNCKGWSTNSGTYAMKFEYEAGYRDFLTVACTTSLPIACCDQ